MPLNIGGSGGKPYCKYHARSGKWFVRGAEGQDKEIDPPTFVADLENIATGWLKFREGQQPERSMDASLDNKAPCPGEEFKRGFAMLVFSPKSFGGVVEIASTSIHMSNAVKELYGQFEREKGAHPGKLPVVACTGSQPMKDRLGTNYKPILTIISWVDRPVELPDVSAASADETYTGTGASTVPAKDPARPVPPPEPRRSDPPEEPLF